MPRATLPRCLLKLDTMEVFLTKTTEEQIWTHLETLVVGLEDKIDDYAGTLDNLTALYQNTNPYDKYTIQDLRDDRPRKKHYHDKKLWLTEVSEEYAEGYSKMWEIIHDVRLCIMAFPEWEERLLDVIWRFDGLKSLFDTDDLIMWERIKYDQSKKKFQEEDAEFLAERSLLRSHRDTHLTREEFLTDEFYRRVVYDNKEPDYWDTCKWCIQHEKMLQDIKDSEKEEERKNQEMIQRYEERVRKEQAERIANTHYYTCEVCDYKTSNIDAYERHTESKEHKVKQNHKDWFCECCNIQSRSKNEHEFHLKTTKHQQNAGLIVDEPKMFRCECCDYETLRKDFYKLHLGSKKHIKNSAEK